MSLIFQVLMMPIIQSNRLCYVYTKGNPRMVLGYKNGLGVQEWPGGTRMTWGYKNGLGVQEWPGGTRMTWGYKNGLGIQGSKQVGM